NAYKTVNLFQAWTKKLFADLDSEYRSSIPKLRMYGSCYGKLSFFSQQVHGLASESVYLSLLARSTISYYVSESYYHFIVTCRFPDFFIQPVCTGRPGSGG